MVEQSAPQPLRWYPLVSQSGAHSACKRHFFFSILYDSRDADAQIAKDLLQKVAVFTDLIETERSTISNRSIKLFTLSGIYHATQNVLAGRDDEPVDAKLHLAAEFWNEVAEHIPDWKLAKQRKVSAADLRRDFIHAHTLALVSLGRAGNELLRYHPRDWKSKLGRLKTLDWSRNNAKLWEGRAMNAGRLSKR